MSQGLTLFHYWRSSCSWRVRWALLYKQIPFEKVHIHLLKHEQKSESYLNLNPNGLVPALKVGSNLLTESLAIIEWLEEVYPQRPLLPKDPWQRAKARELALVVAAGMQPLQNLRTSHRHSDDPAEREAWAKWAIEGGLKVLENHLHNHSGPYCLGSELTIADLFLVPQIYNALRNKVDMSRYPRCQAIYETCLRLQECAAASPEQQPEATV